MVLLFFYGFLVCLWLPVAADLKDVYQHAKMPDIHVETINDYDSRGKTPLLYAASVGHLETVMNILKAGANVSKPAKRSSDTALFYAAELGHDVVVAELIKAGANVDVVSSHGTTPIFSACQAGYTRTVAVLLEAGASVNPTSESGVNPLMIAAMRGKYNTVLKILEKHSEMVNDVSSTGETALMYSILSGSLETVVALLENGADIDAVADKGMTVFHHAAHRDRHEILEILAVHPQAEEVIDVKDKYGRTALDLAQYNDFRKSIDILLIYGAAISKKGGVRMSKEVRKARNAFLSEREIAKKESEQSITISLV